MTNWTDDGRDVARESHTDECDGTHDKISGACNAREEED